VQQAVEPGSPAGRQVGGPFHQGDRSVRPGSDTADA
jgi:hypothetical protein